MAKNSSTGLPPDIDNIVYKCSCSTQPYASKCNHICDISSSPGLPASSLLQILPRGADGSESHGGRVEPLCWRCGAVNPRKQQSAGCCLWKVQPRLWWVSGCWHWDGRTHSGTDDLSIAIFVWNTKLQVALFISSVLEFPTKSDQTAQMVNLYY